MKQWILIRTDLKMRRGKEISQGAHASMKATIENMNHPNVQEWLGGKFTKIALGVSSEEELKSLLLQAEELGVITAEIVDEGLTEFNGVHTLTAGAIGPADQEDLKGLLSHLKLR